MTRHLEHLHYPVAGNQQAIPASDLTSNYEITRPVGYLEFPAHRAEAILSDHSSEQRSQHSLNSSEVLPAPFKLHKPPPPSRLPSSRCI